MVGAQTGASRQRAVGSSTNSGVKLCIDRPSPGSRSIPRSASTPRRRD